MFLTNTVTDAETSVNSYIDSIFNAQIASEALTVTSVLVVLLSALILGALIAFVYIFTQRKHGCDTSLSISLIMIPAVVAVIVMLVGNSYARAFTLAGAFSIVRYRSLPATPKDISYVFMSLAIGLGCGIGYVGYALLFCVVFILVMLLISATGFGYPKKHEMQLKVVVPENLNFEGIIDDILASDTVHWRLAKVKTSDFGTMFELIYRLKLKNGVSTKEFMDKIRCRNGNMNVVITYAADETN